MNKTWTTEVLDNFEKASHVYDDKAALQRRISSLLAQKCAAHNIPPGIWVDLGAGTGLLADALEKCNAKQKVIRVDGSRGMLKKQSIDSPKEEWDLNLGLPEWSEAPTLIASSFALHWLAQPESKLKEWFKALRPGGWLALAVPIEGSFPEWHHAALTAKVPCTALELPSQSLLLKAVPAKCIRFQEIHKVSQLSNGVISLLRPMRQLGAHATQNNSMKVGEWRKLIDAWNKTEGDGIAKLTWSIQLLLLER